METALCPRCGAPTPANAAQCPSCAARLEVTKPAVGPPPSTTPPGEFEPTAPPNPAGSLAGPDRPWVPPDASPHPTTEDHDQGWETPQPRPGSRRPALLAGGGVLVLVAVLIGVFVTTGRSHQRTPRRPAAAASASTTTVDSGVTAPDALWTPDTLGGLPRAPLPFALPLIAGGRFVTEWYSSPDERQVVQLIAARPGEMGPPADLASFLAQSVIDGSPGTFRPYPREGLEIRCADRKGLNGEVINTVCYLDRPDLQVVVNFVGVSATRIPDLVAEAYHKLKT